MSLSKEFLEKIKFHLEREKKNLEDSLSKIAKKNTEVKDDYEAQKPLMGESLEESLINGEIEADEIEELANRTGIEQELELQLKDVNEALSKIEKNKYGICENCGKEIPRDRLEANPTARLCLKCVK